MKKNDLQTLEKEYEAAKACDIRLVFHNGDHALFSNFGYLEFSKQAKFHPLKYLLALRQIAEKNGVLFFDNTEALSIKNRDPIVVTTPKGTIHADKVLIATYDPSRTTFLGKRVCIVPMCLREEFPKGKYTKDCIWTPKTHITTHGLIIRRSIINSSLVGGLKKGNPLR